MEQKYEKIGYKDVFTQKESPKRLIEFATMCFKYSF